MPRVSRLGLERALPGRQAGLARIDLDRLAQATGHALEDRLDDVVGELEKRQRSLKIQAGRARRFLDTLPDWEKDF